MSLASDYSFFIFRSLAGVNRAMPLHCIRNQTDSVFEAESVWLELQRRAKAEHLRLHRMEHRSAVAVVLSVRVDALLHIQ